MFRRSFIILSIAFAFAGTAALAQGFRGRAPFGGRLNLERMQQRLNLTNVQVDGLRALTNNRRTEMESVRGELQQKKQTLHQLIQQPNPNPTDVGNATLALKEVRNRTKEINQRFIAGVKGLLTPEQLQKLPKRFQS